MSQDELSKLACKLFEAYREERIARGDLNCATWDQVIQNRPILEKAWLAVAEKSYQLLGAS
jgi:hypothetical protein